MDKSDFLNTPSTIEDVQRGLETLFLWARNVKGMPSDITGIEDRALDRISCEQGIEDCTEIYDLIDKFIFEYEILEERGETTLKKYIRDDVYAAGIACYQELNHRMGRYTKHERWRQRGTNKETPEPPNQKNR